MTVNEVRLGIQVPWVHWVLRYLISIQSFLWLVIQRFRFWLILILLLHYQLLQVSDARHHFIVWNDIAHFEVFLFGFQIVLCEFWAVLWVALQTMHLIELVWVETGRIHWFRHSMRREIITWIRVDKRISTKLRRLLSLYWKLRLETWVGEHLLHHIWMIHVLTSKHHRAWVHLLRHRPRNPFSCIWVQTASTAWRILEECLTLRKQWMKPIRHRIAILHHLHLLIRQQLVLHWHVQASLRTWPWWAWDLEALVCVGMSNLVYLPLLKIVRWFIIAHYNRSLNFVLHRFRLLQAVFTQRRSFDLLLVKLSILAVEVLSFALVLLISLIVVLLISFALLHFTLSFLFDLLLQILLKFSEVDLLAASLSSFITCLASIE